MPELDKNGIPIKKKSEPTVDRNGIPIKKKNLGGLPSDGTPSTSAYLSPQERRVEDIPAPKFNAEAFIRGTINRPELPADSYNLPPHEHTTVKPKPLEKPKKKTLNESISDVGAKLENNLTDNPSGETQVTQPYGFRKVVKDGITTAVPDYTQDKTKTALPENQQEFAGTGDVGPSYLAEIPIAIFNGTKGVLTDMMRGGAALGSSAYNALDIFDMVDDVRGQDLALYKLGNYIDANIDAEFANTPEFQKSFIGKLSQGAGSLIPFAAGGWVGSAFKYGSVILPSTIGALQNGGAEFKAAIESGADEDTAMKAFYGAAGIGTLEGLPIASWANKFNKSTGGTFNKALASKLRGETIGSRGIMGVVEEGTQEATSQFLTNVNASATYDETRKLLEGVMEAGVIGGILGGVLNGATQALEAKKLDPHLTPQERIIIQKSLDLVNEKKAKYEKADVKPDDLVKLDDDAPEVQELKKQKTELEADMVNKNVSPEIKEKVAEKIVEVDKAIEITKEEEAAKDGAKVQAEAESSVLNEQLATLEAMKEQATSPETKAVIDEDIAAKAEQLAQFKEVIQEQPLNTTEDGQKINAEDQANQERLLVKQEDAGGAQVPPVVEKSLESSKNPLPLSSETTPITEESTKGNAQKGVIEPIQIPQSKVGKGKIPLDDRELSGDRKVASQITVTQPLDQALQFFIRGGRINSQAIQSLFGNKKGKSIAKELKSRIGYVRTEEKEGKTIDQIAHFLWENQTTPDQFTSMDFKNAVELAIGENTSISQMSDKLKDKYPDQFPQETQDETESRQIEEEAVAPLHEEADFNDQAWNSAVEAVENADEKTIEQMAMEKAWEEDQASRKFSSWDEAFKALENAKINTKGTLNAFGLLPATWNAAIDIIIAAVKAGKAISVAIKEAIDYIKSKGETVDEEKFTKFVEDHFTNHKQESGNKGTKTEKTTKPVEEKKEKSTQKESSREERRFTKQFIKEYPNLEASLDEDTIHYDSLPNKVTLAEANAIIDYLGTEEAAKAFTDLTNGMTMPVRNTVGQVLIKRLESEGEVDKAIDILEELTKNATEMGQGIQALSMFQYLSPEGALRSAQREVNKQRDDLKKKSKDKLKKLDQGLRDINKEAAEEAVDKVIPKTDVDNIKPKPTKTPSSYGSKNKVVSKQRYEQLKKALKGKLFSNVPPELIEIAVYHAEATGRKVADFTKNMISDFGGKIRPYLKDLYKKAKGELKDKGYTDEDFASDEEIGAAIAESFTDKEIQKSVKEGLKDLGLSVKDIVVKHYTVYDNAKRTLTEKLIQDAGLEPSEAKSLAQAIQKEFDRVATEKKKQLIAQVLRGKAGKLAKAVGLPVETKKAEKSLEDELIKMTNIGAFSSDEVGKQYGDSMGWPKLTKENLKEIERLAGIVQSSPEGFKKFRAIEDLLKYQANLKSISKWEIALSLWYANILSGYKTQAVNIVSNIANSIFEYTTATLQNPKRGVLLAKGYLQGIKKGFPEANAVLKTGYSPIRGKVEVPPTLERVRWTGFGKLFKYHKYVRRAMVAADVLFFEGLKEMRAWQWAAKSAANENKLNPTEGQKKSAMDYMNFNDTTLKEAQQQAEAEYQEDLEKIDSLKLDDKEKRKRVKEAKEDRRRRINELIEGKRSPNVLEESRSFAARGTYNYKPEGVLGALSEGANRLGEKLPPFRLIVPFTNIIANVANQGLNFTPWGFLRAAAPSGTASSFFNDKLGRKDWDSMTSEQQSQAKVDLMTKAIQGTAMATALFMMSQKWDDDDEPWIEITANGTGDYKKNYQLQETGWQPYSIKIGGRWYSYQYSPLLPILSFIGNLNDYDKYRKEKITDEGVATKVGTAATASMRTFLDGTFLSNLNTFLNTIVETDKEDIKDDAIKALLNTGRGFVVPNLYTQAAKDIQAIFDIPTKEVGGTLTGQLLRDVPIARDKFSNKINVLGEEIIPDTDKFTSKVQDSPAFQLIVDKKAWIAPLSIRKTTIEDPETDEPRLMTQEEFYQFSKFRGEYIKNYILDNLESLQEMEAEEVRKELETVKSDATDEAKIQLLETMQ